MAPELFAQLALVHCVRSPYGASFSADSETHQILGTNCGLAAGIGTFVANPGSGGGAFGTIAANATYSCQFDGQFCSALDNNSCISNSDTASATLKGDEASDVAFAQGGNTLTVKECFTATVTTAGP